MDSSVDSNGPMKRLGPRTTGRRFRRRQEHDTAATNEEVARTTSSAESNDEAEFRRKPRPDIESRIDAAISARKEHTNPLLTQEDLPGETEILGNYEYLDHTADIQLHSWGESFEEALTLQIIAMFGYMTKLSLIEIDEEAGRQYGTAVQAQGHDVQSLVFACLQEWLTLFHETGFIVRELYDVQMDWQQWKIQCSGRGQVFDPMKHTTGTEVKAVTYSNLTVEEADGHYDIWVIVDI